MRHPKPQALIDYEAKLHRLMEQCPKVCHNCINYGTSGECNIFGQAPPAEFASTPGGCDKWDADIPF
jgi:hypothetical protein